MPAPPLPTPRRRLGGLTNPAARMVKKTGPPRAAARKHTCCEDPKIEDDEDGRRVCKNCYTEISENNIVADVTFQEDSRGAATVQGGFIGETARHARTLGTAARRLGGGERNSLQQTEATARHSLAKICPRLGIPDTVAQQASNLYLLASQSNFCAGRRTDEVVAACLYAACRRQKDNTVLLVDISEVIHTGTFRLGEVYKGMCQTLYLDQGGVGQQHIVEVESLVMKYCRKLEFGEATRQVAEDAVKIVRRMKRDWMVTGRHPAGLCGACIILAARMNNFRRTTREVVYVSKVADATIAKRVEEFRRTKSAALTVEQFREFGVRLKHQNDPPIFYESELNKRKFEAKKRRREAESLTRERENSAVTVDASLSSASPSPSPSPSPSSRETSTATATPVPEQEAEGERASKRQKTTAAPPTPAQSQQQPPRYDADGFAIPALPVAAAAAAATGGEEPPPKQKQGRRQRPAPEPIIITEEELADEAYLEHEIDETLNDDELIDSRNELQQAKEEERRRALADRQKQIAAETNKARRAAEGITWLDGSINTNDGEFVTDDDLEAEFANDPEVINCRLSEDEQKIKEQIWVFHNEDWLRIQHEKKLLAEVTKGASGSGAKRGAGASGAKGGKRRKKGRMGDGTTLTEAGTPIETPADATQAMMEKRAPAGFSKFINYEALSRIYGDHSSRSTSRAPSETPSASGTEPSASPSPARRRGAASPPPPPPAATQKQAQTSGDRQSEAGDDDDDDDDDEDDPNDYHPSDYNEQDYNSDQGDGGGGWAGGDDDDREDIGEEADYRRAVDFASNRDADAFDEF